MRNDTFDLFLLDAPAHTGNSGGPLFDPLTAQVMGVMNMVLIKSTRESALSQPSGISYTIPAVHVRDRARPLTAVDSTGGGQAGR